jgi:hypothetical protein
MKKSELQQIIREEISQIVAEKVQPSKEVGYVIIATDQQGNSGYVAGDSWLLMRPQPTKLYDLKTAKRMLNTYLSWQQKVAAAKTSQELAYANLDTELPQLGSSDVSEKKAKAYTATVTFAIHGVTLGNKI